MKKTTLTIRMVPMEGVGFNVKYEGWQMWKDRDVIHSLLSVVAKLQRRKLAHLLRLKKEPNVYENFQIKTYRWADEKEYYRAEDLQKLNVLQLVKLVFGSNLEVIKQDKS
jgi:hypothetical protein